MFAGTLLCICIVWCNLAVMRALCRTGRCDNKHRVLTRRISRNQSLTYNACTKEELAFARLMALLCIVFVLCWMPQMVVYNLNVKLYSCVHLLRNYPFCSKDKSKVKSLLDNTQYKITKLHTIQSICCFRKIFLLYFYTSFTLKDLLSHLQSNLYSIVQHIRILYNINHIHIAYSTSICSLTLPVISIGNVTHLYCTCT